MTDKTLEQMGREAAMIEWPSLSHDTDNTTAYLANKRVAFLKGYIAGARAAIEMGIGIAVIHAESFRMMPGVSISATLVAQEIEEDIVIPLRALLPPERP